MYNVSEKYREAISRNVREYYVEGEIMTETGRVIPVNHDTLYEKSLSVTNQCVNGSEFEWGAVFSAEASLGLKTDVDRYEMYNAVFRFSFFLEVDEKEYEEIPMGVYTVSECNRSGNLLSITCLDHMILLEKDLEEDTNGAPYDLLLFIAEKCGVELAQTREEIESFANGTALMTLYANRIETYRDAVSYIAHVLCGFVLFDRFGKLKICRYAKEKCWTIKSGERYNVSVSDFRTYFQALKVRFVKDGAYQLYSRENTSMPDGLLYDMGDIPIIQGVEEFKETVLDAIWQQLQEIIYTPCEMDCIGNPAIDLGDLVSVEEIGKDNEEIKAYITYYDWQYRSKCRLKSAGGNPKLSSAKSRVSKQLTSMETDIGQKDVVVHTYTNAKSYQINTRETEVASINYAASSETKSIFVMTIQVKMESDGYLGLRYTKNFMEVPDTANLTYLHKGQNTVSVMLYLSDKENTRNTFRVLAYTEYVESEERILKAEIEAVRTYAESLAKGNPKNIEPDIDKTIPKGMIAVYGVRCALYGQGLASNDRWDGTISASDDVPYINTLPLEILPCNDRTGFTSYDPIRINREETEYIELIPLQIRPFQDDISCIEEEENE